MILHLLIDTHTFAVVHGLEKYDLLKNALAPVLKEINDIKSRGFIYMNNSKFSLKFYLGADFKVCMTVQ